MSELPCETLSFPSSDGHNTVAGYLYLPRVAAPRAVLQLSHGMCEYVQRYRQLAAFFAAQGIAVAGNDHLGHGATAAEPDRGHYGEAHGAEHVLQDLRAMNTLLHARFPDVPILLYGHSMGSFFARWYAETWPDTIHALILSGTAGPDFANRAGEVLAAVLAAVRGERHVSSLMVRLNFGGYNRRITRPASKNAWLTRDEACVSAYDADPLCTFSFTIGTYREMLRVLNHVSTRAWAAHIPAGLPVLLVAGEDDPVGNYGKGVRRVYQMLRTAGVRDVTCRLWKGGRHEMHNELDRDAFLHYVLGWAEQRIPRVPA
jgi:alpha-beta hydrolase superfamily lysophospholipase